MRPVPEVVFTLSEWGEDRPRSTWQGLLFIALNNRSSAISAISIAPKAVAGRKPPRFILPRKRSILSLSLELVNPTMLARHTLNEQW